MGVIRGDRLDPEVKLELVDAVVDAKRQGFAITRSCELLMLGRRRFHRWVEGKDLDANWLTPFPGVKSALSALRVLRSAQLVCDFVRLPRPTHQKPDKVVTEPNQIWGWDLERHEALLNRAVMEGHRLRALAGVLMKLGAA